MMKTFLTAMMTSISEVMETMFYLPVEFDQNLTLIQSGMDKDRQSMRACQLEFTGAFSGCFTLLIPNDLLLEMTENFMGESRERLEEVHAVGTLTETLNMICGNTLSRLNSSPPLELDIPKVMDPSNIPESELYTIVKTPQSRMAIHVEVN